MLTIKFQLLFLISICLCYNTALAQKSTSGRQYREDYYHYSIDTFKFKSPEMEIVYNLERKMGLKKKILNSGDSIFNAHFNAFSVMHLTLNNKMTIDIPTIPIDDIIIDDSMGLILCLSRAMVSPYQIVLYDFDGNILYKKILLPFEVVLNTNDYIQFQKLFPSFYKHAKNQDEIHLVDSLYYVDLSYWHKLSKQEQNSIMEKKWFKFSHYFPSLFNESTGSLPSYQLGKYQNFYSRTDPFYEYRLNQDETLKSIILNNEYGSKVEIPVHKGIKVKTKE